MGRLTIKQAIEYWKIFLDEIEELKATPGTDPEEWDKQEKATVAALEALVKQRHYEDLEEQGRLYVLPCGIEKPLYALIPRLDWEGGYLETKWRISTVVPRNVEECLRWEDDMKRGLAFLTKEEAEAKLKELEGDKE